MMFRFIPYLLCLLLLVVPSQAWDPDAVLVIEDADLSADCTIRSSVVINGTSPGPPLRFTEGQHVFIRVWNKMATNTTLHFHGLSQWFSPFADGTPQTSQWPIGPGAYFDYEFLLETGSAGTYMYHTHVDFDIVTAYGAFIVDQSEYKSGPVPFDYDEELTVLFGDFYHEDSHRMVEKLLGSPFDWIGEPQSLTVNGDALGVCTGPACTTTCKQHALEVEAGKVYRVRVIGIMALTYLYLAIEHHPAMVLIEVDGHYIRPTIATHMQLGSGQRFSVIIYTKTEEELQADGGRRNFWGRMQSRYRPIRDSGSFLLSYKNPDGSSSVGGLARQPAPLDLNVTVSLPDEGVPWVDKYFEPLDEDAVPPPANEVTRRIEVSGHQLVVGDDQRRWFISNMTYVEGMPLVPYLVQAYSTPSTYKPNYTDAMENLGWDSITDTYPIKLGETVEILLTNLASTSGETEAHPWHIHGQHPWYIAGGKGPFSEEALANATNSGYTPRRPLQRDTVVIMPGAGASYTKEKVPAGTETAWLLFRLKAENPGAWLAHCHLQPHAQMGMAFVLTVGMDELPPLPKGFKDGFMHFNGAHQETPMSYFKLVEQFYRRGLDQSPAVKGQ